MQSTQRPFVGWLVDVLISDMAPVAWITRFNYFPILPSSRLLPVPELSSEDQVYPLSKGCVRWQSVFHPFWPRPAPVKPVPGAGGAFHFTHSVRPAKHGFIFSETTPNCCSLTLFAQLEMWSVQIKRKVQAGAELAASSEGHIYIHFNMQELVPALRQSCPLWAAEVKWWLTNQCAVCLFHANIRGFTLSVDLHVCFWCSSRMLSCCRLSVRAEHNYCL